MIPTIRFRSLLIAFQIHLVSILIAFQSPRTNPRFTSSVWPTLTENMYPNQFCDIGQNIERRLYWDILVILCKLQNLIALGVVMYPDTYCTTLVERKRWRQSTTINVVSAHMLKYKHLKGDKLRYFNEFSDWDIIISSAQRSMICQK